MSDRKKKKDHKNHPPPGHKNSELAENSHPLIPNGSHSPEVSDEVEDDTMVFASNGGVSLGGTTDASESIYEKVVPGEAGETFVRTENVNMTAKGQNIAMAEFLQSAYEQQRANAEKLRASRHELRHLRREHRHKEFKQHPRPLGQKHVYGIEKDLNEILQRGPPKTHNKQVNTLPDSRNLAPTDDKLRVPKSGKTKASTLPKEETTPIANKDNKNGFFAKLFKKRDNSPQKFEMKKMEKSLSPNQTQSPAETSFNSNPTTARNVCTPMEDDYMSPVAVAKPNDRQGHKTKHLTPRSTPGPSGKRQIPKVVTPDEPAMRKQPKPKRSSARSSVSSRGGSRGSSGSQLRKRNRKAKQPPNPPPRQLASPQKLGKPGRVPRMNFEQDVSARIASMKGYPVICSYQWCDYEAPTGDYMAEHYIEKHEMDIKSAFIKGRSDESLRNSCVKNFLSLCADRNPNYKCGIKHCQAKYSTFDMMMKHYEVKHEMDRDQSLTQFSKDELRRNLDLVTRYELESGSYFLFCSYQGCYTAGLSQEDMKSHYITKHKLNMKEALIQSAYDIHRRKETRDL